MANVREIKDQLAEAGEDVADAANAGAAEVEGEMHRLGAKLRSNGAELEDNLREAGDRFAEAARNLGAAASEQVREHPLAAAGVAFAAGMIVSRWLRAR